MNEREKIIKALEVCAVGKPCDGCPLKAECKGTTNAAMAGALKLLKNKNQQRIEKLLHNLKTVLEEINNET